MDDLLRTLGLCKRAGRLEAGEEPAGTACQRRKCRLLLVAEDAAENTVRRAEHLAGTGGCLCAQVPYSKEVLGQRPRPLGRGGGGHGAEGGEDPDPQKEEAPAEGIAAAVRRRFI